eukprot:jgi/Picsp_1/1606/NSC_05084-R1_---NA---
MREVLHMPLKFKTIALIQGLPSLLGFRVQVELQTH